jgi:hypothetical protein
MLKNYFKLAYRNLLKNKLSSFINIVGLSVAIGCSIVFFLMLDLEYTSDRLWLCIHSKGIKEHSGGAILLSPLALH